MSSDVGLSCGLDPVLLWLWCRPAAIAPFRPLVWEPPCAMGMTLKRQKTKQNKKSFNSYITALSLCVCVCLRVEQGGIFIYLFIFWVFLPFLGLLPWHMEVPRLGI